MKAKRWRTENGKRGRKRREQNRTTTIKWLPLTLQSSLHLRGKVCRLCDGIERLLIPPRYDNKQTASVYESGDTILWDGLLDSVGLYTDCTFYYPIIYSMRCRYSYETAIPLLLSLSPFPQPFPPPTFCGRGKQRHQPSNRRKM